MLTIITIGQGRVDITEGTQKCAGAAPIFRRSAARRKVLRVFEKSKKTTEPIAWVKKYLRLVLRNWEDLVVVIRGIIDIKLISNPTHMVIQLVLEIVRVVPKNTQIKNSGIEGEVIFIFILV